MKRLSIILFLTLLSNLPAFSQSVTKLRIVTAPHQLLQYKENNQLKGTTIEILNLLLNDSKIEAKVEFMPWARAYNIAKNNSNTLILSMIRTPDRENKFYWLGIVSQLSRVFISLKNKPDNFVKNDFEAKQKKTAVVRNSNSHFELIKKGFIEGENLYLVSSINQAFRLLLKGDVELVYNDPNVVKNFIINNSSIPYELAYQPITAKNHRDSYIALNINSDVNLVKQLTVSMTKIKQTAKYKALVLK